MKNLFSKLALGVFTAFLALSGDSLFASELDGSECKVRLEVLVEGSDNDYKVLEEAQTTFFALTVPESNRLGIRTFLSYLDEAKKDALKIRITYPAQLGQKTGKYGNFSANAVLKLPSRGIVVYAHSTVKDEDGSEKSYRATLDCNFEKTLTK